MTTFKIQDREAGNVFEGGLTLIEAKQIVEEWESQDKNEGTFTENYYEIVEEEETNNN